MILAHCSTTGRQARIRLAGAQDGSWRLEDMVVGYVTSVSTENPS